MLRLTSILFALLAALPAQQPQTVRVGTWNLEFLGADPKYRRDTPPRDDADVARIGQQVRELGVSLLGVQEICGEQVLTRVAAAAGPTWRAVLGTTGKWSDGKTQQGVGLLYDSQVLDLVHCEELLDFPSERDGVSVFHRKPVTACVRHRATGADFRVVIVHLKAGRKDRDQQKRRAEANTLREFYDALASDKGEDHDVLIMGDFNCTYGAAPETILERQGAMQYLDQQQPAPTILHFDEPIDQVCVGAGFAEVQRDSLRVHGVTGDEQRLAFRKTYSDHFPVTFELAVAGDDDPQATFHEGPQDQLLPTSRRAAGAAPATGAWPPAVGSRVQVMIDGTLHRGRLATPLPLLHGWVVIEDDGGQLAFPRRNITWLRVVK